MIDACRHANVKLMIAYRQQYEPMNRTLEKAVREGKLGKVRNIIASNRWWCIARRRHLLSERKPLPLG